MITILMKNLITHSNIKKIASIVLFNFHSATSLFTKKVHNKYIIERTDWCIGVYILRKKKSQWITIPIIHMKNILIPINTMLSIMCQLNCNLNYVSNARIVY